MVVEPAECGEVVGVGASTLSPRDDVVDLESVAAGAAVNGACGAVAGQDRPAEPGRDHPAAAAVGEGDTVGGDGSDLDDPVAQDRFECCGSDLGSGFESDPGFSVGGCGVGGVDEHGEQWRVGVDCGAVAPGEGVEADRPEGVGPARPACGAVVGVRWQCVGGVIECVDEDAAGYCGEFSVDAPRRFVQIALHREVAAFERFAFSPR